MTRDDLITAIATNLTTEGGIDGMSAPNAAISAIATIEALGFVIVPRVADDLMRTYSTAHMQVLYRRFTDPSLPDLYKAQWDGAIAGSPLYREVKG